MELLTPEWKILLALFAFFVFGIFFAHPKLMMFNFTMAILVFLITINWIAVFNLIKDVIVALAGISLAWLLYFLVMAVIFAIVVFTVRALYILLVNIIWISLRCPRCKAKIGGRRPASASSDGTHSVIFRVCADCGFLVDVDKKIINLEFPHLYPSLRKYSYIRFICMLDRWYGTQRKEDRRPLYMSINYVPHPLKDFVSNYRYRRKILYGNTQLVREEGAVMLKGSSSKNDMQALVRAFRESGALRATIASVLEESNPHVVLPVLTKAVSSEKDETIKSLLARSISKLEERQKSFGRAIEFGD